MSHGSSPASWTAVVVCLAGFTIGGIGLVVPGPNWTLFTIGCVLAVGALLVGVIMAAAGYGMDRSSSDH